MEKCDICKECKLDVFVSVLGTFCEDCFEDVELED